MVHFNAENAGVNNKKLPELDIIGKNGTVINDATSNEITYRNGDIKVFFTGKDIKYKEKDGALKVVGGKFYTIEVFDGNDPIYTIKGLNIKAKKFINKVMDGDLKKVLKNTIFDDKDKIWGSFLDDKLYGFNSGDKIKGWGGDDEIHGGKGNDTLTGYTGNDAFVFDTKPSPKNNVDRLKDFNKKHDEIWLDNKIFKKLDKGKLSGDMFAKKKARDEDDYIVYKKGKGNAYYDPDGDGDKKKILFAELDKDQSLSHHEFFVI